MLKIKDDKWQEFITRHEEFRFEKGCFSKLIEKYGGYISEDDWFAYFQNEPQTYNLISSGTQQLQVDDKKRIVLSTSYFWVFRDAEWLSAIDVLFDLIQAGLVENVADNE